MKRIWNIKKKSGVSPVIATILMVAITVVLAAVLYVMVMNMSGNQGATAPQGSFASSSVAVDGKSVNCTFGSFSKSTKITDLKIVIENQFNAPGTNQVAGTWTATTSGSPAAAYVPAVPSNNVTKMVYYDLAGNGIINIGDTLSIEFTAGTHNGQTPYKVSMVYVPTGDVIDYEVFSY